MRTTSAVRRSAPAAYRTRRRLAQRTSSPGSGGTLGAFFKNLIRPAPVTFPARFLKNSAAVSTTPTFSATAAAIHWFRDRSPCSCLHPSEYIGGANDRYFEPFASRREIRDVVGNQRVGVAVNGCFQHHLIARVASLRSPLKMNLDRLDQRRQLGEQFVDFPECQPVGQSVFGPLEHLFVLEEQRRRGEEPQTSLRHQAQEGVCRPEPAAQPSHNYRGIENDPPHL